MYTALEDVESDSEPEESDSESDVGSDSEPVESDSESDVESDSESDAELDVESESESGVRSSGSSKGPPSTSIYAISTPLGREGGTDLYTAEDKEDYLKVDTMYYKYHWLPDWLHISHLSRNICCS